MWRQFMDGKSQEHVRRCATIVLAVSGYVDIHAHVLPGIDDGPDQLEESIEMATAAAASGTGTLAATPHLHSAFPDVHVGELASRCQGLRKALEERAIPIGIVAGAEISVAWLVDATDEDLALASYGQRGTDVLIETPSNNAMILKSVVPHLQKKGYRVTLAHPERALEVQRDHEWLRPMIGEGMLLAIDADSLLGGHGSGPGRAARRLCTDGLAHVITSDGHRASGWRPVTLLDRAHQAAARLVGRERADWMTHDVPRAILEGTALPEVPAPVEPRHKWRLFGRG
jgi:protein-tyrosine phosphatase